MDTVNRATVPATRPVTDSTATATTATDTAPDTAIKKKEKLLFYSALVSHTGVIFKMEKTI